ncbi:MAG: 50S ribosomal protein L9, partial [Bacteroidales bacterium]|nr:50S ribosomal protein L9 [Bacteroidales bacterium]
KVKNDAVELAASLEGVTLTVGAKASTTGKIFGSVNNIQIAEALKEKGFDIDRKKIIVKSDNIKEVGSYEAVIKLHKEVSATISFEIIAE